MYLSNPQIESIESYLIRHGLEVREVREDVLDHICCEIEKSLEKEEDFAAAFAAVKETFSPQEIATIQTDTHYFLTFKSSLLMVKGIFISAYAALSLYAFPLGLQNFFVYFLGPDLGTMLLAVMKAGSVSLFCFVFLPLLFLYGYRRFTDQMIGFVEK